MKSRYFFELSKEHNSLALEEIKQVLFSEGIEYKVLEYSEDFLLIETNNILKEKLKKISNRLTQTFVINKFLFTNSIKLEDLKEKARNNNDIAKGSVAVKYRNRSENIDSQEVVKVLADVYTKNREVDLSNPDVEIRALITDKKIYVGIKKAVVNRSDFEKRKVQNRPFFSPITLHPRLARALVNISGIKKDEVLFDPFCGTGGFLIEAGLIGFKIKGSDIEEKMIKGCKKTLDFFKIKDYHLFVSDIGEIDNFVENIDCIVTDMPYGKAATTKGEDRLILYKRAFKKISKVLKTNGVAVVGVPDKKIVDVGRKYLNFEKMFSFRVHRSLTRYFLVLKKKN
jgi:tRNA (guanine10-N2)-dimethyltransferase